MKNLRRDNKWVKSSKGQSLVELALLLSLLLTLLTGMVEFGYLLNQYITVVDAAREGARFGSNDDPFIKTTNPWGINIPFFTNIDEIVEGPLTGGVRDPNGKGALTPIRLRPEAPFNDDVVISFFSISDGYMTRFPDADGWSYYQSKGFTGRSSSFTTADLQGRIDQGALSAPDTGMVVVEVFYSYSQILKFWGFIGIPDPIAVHAYAIMPLSAAEPTPTGP